MNDAVPFVRWLAAWRWTDGDVDRRETSDPTWTAVEEAIRALNASDLNDVHIGRDSHAPFLLSICGGAGAYWISGELSSDVFFEAIDPSGTPDERATIMCGGQESRPLANRLVDMSAALAAAEAFYWRGVLAEDLTWKAVGRAQA